MPDHPEHNQRRRGRRHDSEIARCTTPPDPDHARQQFAAARADAHAGRELYFLELAVCAPDDDSARQLELYAYEAYCDAHAIAEEHELEQ